MIRVLIVEDSPVVRQFLEHVLCSDPTIEVIGTARDGEEAIALVEKKRPHVITMDVNMPKMDGFEATRRIMESFPTPIVIVSSSWDTREVETTFRAMEAGAVAVLAKPHGGGLAESEPEARELIRTVKLMSEVKVVKRWPQRTKTAVSTPIPKTVIERAREGIEIVAIGASTGGPLSIKTILSALPASFAVPVLIVQHIALGFAAGFAAWLAGSSRLKVRLAAAGEPITAGHAYVAPDGLHLGVQDSRRIELSRNAPENGVRPSVSYLFRSIAKIFGRKAAGILLSGMGVDGAAELKLLKEAGAVTFAQDEASCVVYGMPGEAVKLGAAPYVLPPEKIAAALAALVNGR